MRHFVAGLLLAGLAAAANAQCIRLEFAELESLTTEQLTGMRCEYHATMSGNPLNGAYAAKAANRCAVELERLDRILARRYSLKGDAIAVNDELARRCRQQRPK